MKTKFILALTIIPRNKIEGVVLIATAITQNIKMGLRRECELDVYSRAMNKDNEIPSQMEAIIMMYREPRFSLMKVVRAN